MQLHGIRGSPLEQRQARGTIAIFATEKRLSPVSGFGLCQLQYGYRELKESRGFYSRLREAQGAVFILARLAAKSSS